MVSLNDASEIFLKYCIEKKLSSKSLTAYSIDLRQLKKYIEAKKLNNDVKNIKKELLKEYIESLKEGYKPKTVMRKVATLKALFTYLEAEDYILISPFRKMKLNLAQVTSIQNPLSPQELKRLFKEAYKDLAFYAESSLLRHKFIIRDIAVLELLFKMGARVSEICNMKESDIDYTTDEITFVNPSGKQRKVLLTDNQAYKSINKYHDLFRDKIAEKKFFFINRLDKQLNEQSVRHMMLKYTALAGIERHITPQIARQTYAAKLFNEGKDIREIQQALGHLSIISTQGYLQGNVEDTTKVMQMKCRRLV